MALTLAAIMQFPGASVAQVPAVLTANSTRDAVDVKPGDGVCQTTNRGECTLRAAIMEFNHLPPNIYTVVLLSGSTYTLTLKGPGDDTAARGDLDITNIMIIKSSGAGPAIVRGGSGWNDRIFHVLEPFGPPPFVEFNGIQIQNGHADGRGGGILIDGGKVTVKNTTVSGNFASSGGGIAIVRGCLIDDPCSLESSTVSGNTAEVNGGNRSADGGGIWNTGTLNITNSTISGNKATGNGGGIANFHKVFGNNLTIATNTADSDSDGAGGGGGIFNVTPGAVVLNNTILAANLDQSSIAKLPDCAGLIASTFGFNLIQNITGCTIIGTDTGNITGRSAMLGTLRNNGGPTFTHALLRGAFGFNSPAIDAGSTALLETMGACASRDQRGVLRPQDGNGDFIARCDIGAYELQPPASDLGVPSLEPLETTVYAGQHVTYNFTWTVPGPGWRVLDSLHLRIRDEQGVAVWVRFQEVTGAPGTISLVNPKTGEPGPAFAPGSPNRLETNAATLYLGGSTADGPPGSRVGLTLDLSFKPPAAGRTYQVEVLAIDDAGQEQGFIVAGLLTVQ